jgi:hypothetical protein
VLSRTGAITLCLVVSLTPLAASPSAAALPKRITGKLSKPGYAVTALARGGSGRMVGAGRGRFALRPPAQHVTLHLRAPNGTYAGPIVVGRVKNGRRALVGVTAGARLGDIKVRRGFAVVSQRLPERWLDVNRKVRARRGVPIGARNFGYVRSKPPRHRLAADRDRDGIPDRLDVDDDGDLILDYADNPTTASARNHVVSQVLPPEFGVTSFVQPPPSGVTNANARDSADPSQPAFTDADIDAALRSFGALAFTPEGGVSAQPPYFPSAVHSELDCGGDPAASRPALSYCSNPGSTGRAHTSVNVQPGDPLEPFPGAPGGPFDSDGDGFGTFPATKGFGPHLFHGASSTEVRTGDYLVQRGNDANGVETGEVFTTTVQYAFATVPALASYRDTTMAAPATVSYPFPPDNVPPPALPVSAPEGQDVVVKLTFWRPQRRPIPPGPDGLGGDACLGADPACEWVDIGGLNYGAGLCPQSAFLPEDDPSLAAAASPTAVAGNGGYVDSERAAGELLDRPADPANTLTFTVNISACLRTRGQESAFDEVDEVLDFGIQAVGRGGQVSSSFHFRRTEPGG